MRTPLLKNIILVTALASLATTASVADAGHIAVSAQADVRVWVEGGDVFDSYGDVAFWVRPERDCYTTLFMVDTDGYMHVLYPSSAYDDTWLYGGRSYCYRASDLGLDRLDGAGIAYVFAVGSPVPFDYSVYGASVFVGGFGFRVYGDPFIACRDFYMTMLPASCRWDYVGVSYARFYVRHWQRYPSYLCYGGPRFHVHIGDGCRACSDIYVSYRESCARPWDAVRPVPKFKQVYANNDQWDNDRGNVRSSRVERVTRESFKGKGVAQQNARETNTVKHATKPSSRWTQEQVGARSTAPRAKSEFTAARPAKKSQEFTAAKPAKTSQRTRVVSTSSARERASVDRADVAAMTKHTTPAVRSSRGDQPSKRAITNPKAARTESSREKGSKKKQAR